MTQLWEIETSNGTETDGALACKLVVLVGQSSESRREVEGFLRRESPGIVVRHASGSDDAVRAVAAERPDCILIEPATPHEQVLSVLSRIRAVNADVPVVVLSPRDDDELILSLLVAGADDHLFTRRSSATQLWSIVRRAVARRRGLAQGRPPAPPERAPTPDPPPGRSPAADGPSSGPSGSAATPPSRVPRPEPQVSPPSRVPRPEPQVSPSSRVPRPEPQASPSSTPDGEVETSGGDHPVREGASVAVDPVPLIERALSRSIEGLDAVVVFAIEMEDGGARTAARGRPTVAAAPVTERIVGCIDGAAEAVVDESGHVILVVEHIASVDQAFAIAERVGRAAGSGTEEARSGDHVYQGIAVGTNPEETAESLLGRAERALQHATDRHLPYELDDPVSVRLLTQRAAVRNELRDAIANGDLVLDYQPIFELRTGTVRGLEALARWRHPERGKLSPEAIFPMATRSVVLAELTQHVVQLACATTAEWNTGRSEPLFVSVNVDVEELEHPTVLASVGSALSRTGLPADRLWLEIPGDARLSASLETRLTELNELGVGLAIDGIGPALADPDRLAELPFSVAKLELGSAAVLDSDGPARSTVESVVATARDSGLVTVACGIETEAQRDGAIEVGCELGQGFGLGVPLSFSETANLLSGDSPRATEPASRGGWFR